ncbi:hypothetical protein [Pseudomonas sp. DC3000-4b1]|uniref:hypothetical protein n=1 Tax=unclassified Pseudomonas TaxID=196821 RepID=UPI003CF59C9E
MSKPMEMASRWLARACLGALALGASHLAQADAVEITAEYRASEYNDEFRNTTPNSGYCVEYGCETDMFSVSLPITYERTVISGLSPIPDRWSLKTPAEAIVDIVSDQGERASLRFQVTHIAQSVGVGSDGDLGYTENPAAHRTAGGGCTRLEGWLNEDSVLGGFAWRVDNPRSPSVCYPNNEPDDSPRPITPRVWNTSIAYKLIYPPPHTLPMGTYHGSVTFSVGETGDFALGSKVSRLSVNSVTFNFTLSVHHQVSVQFPANSDRVVLEPTGGWQKWLSTGVAPTELTASLPFRLTASGPFSIRMECGEATGPKICAIRNRRTQALTSFIVWVHPPKGTEFAHQPGAPATPFPILDGQSVSFLTPKLLRNSLGKFTFETYDPFIEELLKSPGDDWAGLVTLIFDATL